MDAMQELYLQKLARWQNFMEAFSLPGWEELPDMDLYVDQVVTLVSRYLSLIPRTRKIPSSPPAVSIITFVCGSCLRRPASATAGGIWLMCS